MTDHDNDRRKHPLMDDLISGLLAQKRELGTEGYQLLQLLHAAGYRGVHELYQPFIIDTILADEDESQRH